jgi:hypothetical protein
MGHDYRLSNRTLLIAVVGVAGAALVTSAAALNVGSDRQAVATAIYGASALVGLSAIICWGATALMRGARRRLFWAAISLGVTLTALGGFIRGLKGIEQMTPVGTSIGDFIYAAGFILLIALAVTAPIVMRSVEDLAWPATEALAFSMILLGLLAVLVRGQVASAMAVYGTGRLLAAVAVVFVAVVAGVFLLAALVRSMGHSAVAPLIFFGAGLLLMAASDLAWLYDLIDGLWYAGSLVDFAHIVAHVLIAAGASAALDVESAEQRRNDRVRRVAGSGAAE